MRNYKLSAIKKTIKYARIYRGKLTLAQLETRLISGKKIDIRRDEAKKWLISEEEYGESYGKTQAEKLKRAKELASKLANFPQIMMVGVSGSVAAGYPNQNDDIDLMIITQKDSLWLTRLLVYLWAFLNGVKIRTGNSHHLRDRFCLNLWMERGYLEIPRQKRKLKVAVDTILLIPLVDKGGCWEEFLHANTWVKSFLANGFEEKMKQASKLTNLAATRVGKPGLVWLNKLAFNLQYQYMKKKISKEMVDIRYAFFHPRG